MPNMSDLTPHEFGYPPFLWRRWTQYERVEDSDWIVGTGEPHKIAITATHDVASALAKVASPVIDGRRRLARQPQEPALLRLAALVAFYDDFGVLGQHVLDDTARWSGDGLDVRDGDRSLWAIEHAINVSRILRAMSSNGWPALHRELKEQTITRRRVRARASHGRALADHGVQVTPIWVPLTVPTAVGGGRLQWRQPLPAGALTDRRRLLAALINPNLVGIVHTIDGPEFRTLIDLAYWQLTTRLAEEAELRRCDKCTSLFFVHHRRQRFCPPPPGFDHSRCGRAFSARKRRAEEAS